MTGRWVDAVVRALGERGPAASRDLPIGPLTTYRVGGPAVLAVTVEAPEELAVLGAALVAGAGVLGAAVPTLVVGKGSNLLVSDAGFDGVAVFLGAGFAEIDVSGTRVRAGGAAGLPVVARRTAAAGLTGFEWAVGVPGSVGGGVRMNAGGHGSDIAAVLVRIRRFDLDTGEDDEVPSAALELAYRRSCLTAAQVVVRAEFSLREGDVASAEARVGQIVRWRREHQPGGPNAGSVFTNPPGDSAGRLVDAAGCKGLRIGSAEVSAKHANFVQADAGGSADDVARLMAEVQRRVEAHSGVHLVPETRMVGFGRASS